MSLNGCSFRKRSLRWVAVALSLGLAGCNSEWIRERNRGIEANTAKPVSFKDDILAFMRTYLNNPTGVRDAFVSEPALRAFEGADRYSSCLRYTARKANGQYAAGKDSLVLFRDGRLDRIVDNAREVCKDATFQPFRELEQLSR